MGLVTEVLGIRITQPREYRRLLRLRRAIYTTVAHLRAEIVRSPEPVAFADLDRSAFRPIRPGTRWGRVFDCAWLRITGEVPDGVRDPVVLLGIGGEGLVHSPDGQLLDAVSTVFQQGDLPHAAGGFRPVRGVDTSSGRVEFYADVTYNGFLIYLVGRALYRGARLATRDDGTPDQADSHDATNFSPVKRNGSRSVVSMADTSSSMRVCSWPTPTVSPPLMSEMTATAKPHRAANTTGRLRR